MAVSRYHARLSLEQGYFFIRDLGSLNGLWINGVREAGRYLADSVKVVVPPFMLKFELRLEIQPGSPFGGEQAHSANDSSKSLA